MKVLVTGANGFVGRNLCATLGTMEDVILYPYDRDSEAADLDRFCRDCDFVFHLAGVNRTEDPEDFRVGNVKFAEQVLESLRVHGNRCPVLLTSSVQAELTGRYADSPYGESKRAGEELFLAYGRETGAKVLIYRLPNLFGKWCRPNYNSVVATFCHNIARDVPIQIHDPAAELELVYIDDLLEELLRAMRGIPTRGEDGFCRVPVSYRVTVGRLAERLTAFAGLRERLEVPDLGDGLTRKLYSTYLTYLPREQFCYDLNPCEDARGIFVEMLRTPERGQVSVNVSRPGVTRGEHWHHSKQEKFLVVHGQARIRMRDLTGGEAVEFLVSGERLQVVETIPGWIHSISNLSETDDLVTLIWANEPFDPDRPDTFGEKV